MIKQFPAHLYRDTTQVDIYVIPIHMDSAVVSRYESYTTTTTLYTWSDASITNIAKTINDYLGFSLFTNEKKFYVYRGDAPVYAIPDNLYKARNMLGVNLTDIPTTGNTGAWSVKTYNNSISTSACTGYYSGGNNMIAFLMYGYCVNLHSCIIDTRYRQFTIQFAVFVDDLFDSETGIAQYDKKCSQFTIRGVFAADYETVTSLSIEVLTNVNNNNHFVSAFTPRLNLNNSQASDRDPDNENGPYQDPNTGGDGDFGDPDSKDPTPIPDLPSLGASDFVKIYTPSASVLTSLAQFLWSADTVFNIDNFKKVYNDPSECIVGLSIVPCLPDAAGSKHIMFGNIDTEVSCSYVNTQWVKVDCGWKYIETLVKNFTDYSPYTKLQIFLPYIGFQHINIDEVAGKSIHVVYHVDIISGDLICFIETYADGVIYSFSGNCLATVPVTGSSYGNFLGKYYSQLAQAPSAMISGAMQGGAAGAAMGGLNTLFNAAQTALLDRKALFTHSGSMSGAASIMGVQRPFVIIERPNISVPDYIQNYAGRSSNKTVPLGNCSGFTQVDYVHIDNVAATSEEIKEIETLLHEGVIL